MTMQIFLFFNKFLKEFFVLVKSNKKLFFMSLVSFYQLFSFIDPKELASDFKSEKTLIGALFKAFYGDTKPTYPTPSKEQMATSFLRANHLANALRFGEMRDETMPLFLKGSFFTRIKAIWDLLDLHPGTFMIKKMLQLGLFAYFTAKWIKIIKKSISSDKNNKK